MLTSIYKDESGNIAAVKLTCENSEEAEQLSQAVEHYGHKEADQTPEDPIVEPTFETPPVEPEQEQ